LEGGIEERDECRHTLLGRGIPRVVDLLLDELIVGDVELVASLRGFSLSHPNAPQTQYSFVAGCATARSR